MIFETGEFWIQQFRFGSLSCRLLDCAEHHQIVCSIWKIIIKPITSGGRVLRNNVNYSVVGLHYFSLLPAMSYSETRSSN